MGYSIRRRTPLRRSKFGNVYSCGFASKLEAAVVQILRFREKAGQIFDVRLQHAVELTDAKIRCKIDASYLIDEAMPRIYVEAKGVVTERWAIIEKLWPHYGPGPLELWKGDFRGPKMVDLIKPIGG